MTDAITPVGNTVNPTGSGLSSLSDILGIQQKRIALQQQAQTLQTGQSLQQTAQAEAQQSQQAMGERQQLQNVIKSGVRPDTGKSIYNDQNEVDPDQLADYATRNLSLTGQGIAQNIRKTQQDKIAVQSASADLSDKYKNDLSGITRSFVNNPDAKAADVKAAFQAYAQQNPAAAPVVLNASNLIDHLDGAQGMKAKNDMLLHLGQMFQPAATTASQQQPAITPIGLGKSVALTQTNPLAPGGVSGAGSMPTSLSPAQELPYVGAAAATTAGAASRAGGTGNADVDASNLVSNSLRDARTNIDLTKRIDQLADVVDPGALPAKVSHALGALGLQDVNQARTELQKDLGRLRSSASSRAQSDSRANEILSGLPTDTTPTQTIHQAMDVTRGSARQDLALGALQAKTRQETGGSMSGFQGDYSHAVSSASPLMHEYLALSPADQVGFFKRNFSTAQQAKAFRAQAEAVKKRSPDVVGQ